MTRAVELDWNPSYRLVPSRFPPIGLFDSVASPQELEVAFALQALTNPRLRQEVGQLSLVPQEDRVAGPGSTPVMAAFCHLNPEGSRFSDGTWGVYYAANSLETAVAEVSFHRASFLSHTKQPAIDIDMRSYVGRIIQPLHDVRGRTGNTLHRPDDYGTQQAFARKLRATGAWGVVYRSVRNPEVGQCVAVFRPKAIRVPVTQGPHVTLRWDGDSIVSWYRKSELHEVASLPNKKTRS